MRKEELSHLVTDSFDLPLELGSGVSRIVLVGNGAVRVENHDGIKGFRPEEIRIAAGRGEIVIRGKELSLSALAKEELCAEGRIQCVSLRYEDVREGAEQ